VLTKAVFERVMMPDPHQHLVKDAGVVEPAAEAHPVRYLCDSFVRLKTNARTDKVKYSYYNNKTDVGYSNGSAVPELFL